MQQQGNAPLERLGGAYPLACVNDSVAALPFHTIQQPTQIMCGSPRRIIAEHTARRLIQNTDADRCLATCVTTSSCD